MDASLVLDGRIDAPPPAPDAQDAAPDAEDAATDAGAVDPRATLPADIDCSSYDAVVACDNFDGSASGATVQALGYGGGSVDASGIVTASVPFDGAGGSVQAEFAPINAGELYVRLSLFVPGSQAISGLNIVSVGILDASEDFGLDLNLVDEGSFEIYSTGDDNVASSGSLRVPRDRWTCVLLSIVDVGEAGAVVRANVDGVDAVTAVDVDALPPGGIVGVSSGIDWAFFSQAPATLYIDNFLVTRAAPGACP